MPLAFDTISHGTVAFGFFNIDSDMLLLERYFFFATQFCEHISSMAEVDGPVESVWRVYYIPQPGDIGDLMGAIHGIHYTGFIGEIYRRFPFPERQADFRQKPDGIKNQGIVRTIIAHYARRIEILFVVDEVQREVGIGPYRFTGSNFQELIKYVWLGGYPRWKDGKRPDYVLAMKEKIEQSSNWLLQEIAF
jgi:hypothetical protein